MKWVQRKWVPVDAVQIDERVVLAHLIDRTTPLPLGLKVAGASWHTEELKLYSAMLVSDEKDIECRPGDWVVGPDADGKYTVMSAAKFAEQYELAE